MAASKKNLSDSDEPKNGSTGSKAITEELPSAMLGLPGRITEARERKQWTQDALAQKAGLSQGMVSKLESSESLKGARLVSVVRVAHGLGMSLDELVLGIPNPWKLMANAVQRDQLNPYDAVSAEQGSAPAPPRSPPSDSAPKPKKKRSPR